MSSPEHYRNQLVAVARGHLAPSDVTRALEQAIVQFCNADVEKRLGAIKADVERGAQRPARRKAEAFRKCLSARLHALWKSRPGELRERQGLSPDQQGELRVLRWRALVAALPQVAKLNQPARVRLRAKPKGPPGLAAQRRYRPIFVFDWLDQARQRLIATSLTPFVDLHPTQYLLRQGLHGRGRSAVYKTLLTQLPTLASDHAFVQLDVREFYQSISHEWLEENLPLPRDIIRAQVHSGGMIRLPAGKRVKVRLGAGRPDGAYDKLARQGMPTGSALATLVGEYVMATVLRELADRPDAPTLCIHAPDPFTYSDNIGMLETRARLAAVVDLYRKAFASSAAGPFILTASSPQPARGPFKYLGYQFRLRDNGEAEAYVPEDQADRRLDMITQDILAADAAHLAWMRRRVEGSAAEWSYWSGVAQWEANAYARIALAEEALAVHA